MDPTLPKWRTMDTQDRANYLAPLVGQAIRYVQTSSGRASHKAFKGITTSVETAKWVVSPLLGLRANIFGQPCIEVINNTGIFTALAKHIYVAFDDIWDIQPEAAPALSDAESKLVNALLDAKLRAEAAEADAESWRTVVAPLVAWVTACEQSDNTAGMLRGSALYSVARQIINERTAQ